VAGRDTFSRDLRPSVPQPSTTFIETEALVEPD